MENKEKIYDKEISPLMKKIMGVCKKHDIPFFASFQYSDSDFCTSNGRLGGHIVFTYYDALKQCAEKDGINIDKFMFWIMRGAREKGHSSLVLSKLGIPGVPEAKKTAGKKRCEDLSSLRLVELLNTRKIMQECNGIGDAYNILLDKIDLEIKRRVKGK